MICRVWREGRVAPAARVSRPGSPCPARRALLVIRRVVSRTRECGHRVRSGPHPCGALLGICRVSACTRHPCRSNPPALLARTRESGLSARRALRRKCHTGHFPPRAPRILPHTACSSASPRPPFPAAFCPCLRSPPSGDRPVPCIIGLQLIFPYRYTQNHPSVHGNLVTSSRTRYRWI